MSSVSSPLPVRSADLASLLLRVLLENPTVPQSGITVMKMEAFAAIRASLAWDAQFDIHGGFDPRGARRQPVDLDRVL